MRYQRRLSIQSPPSPALMRFPGKIELIYLTRIPELQNLPHGGARPVWGEVAAGWG